MSLGVRRPGLFSTVQDTGRWGYQHLGVPVAGAMDVASHRLSNALVGNAPSAATLEITLTGPELECEETTLFAVTGAAFDLRLDGVEVPGNTACRAAAGQIISFGQRHAGARAYLSVAGGFGLPAVLGSRSTHVASRMGGLDGRPLRTGDSLAVLQTNARFQEPGKTCIPAFTIPTDGARVRVIVGPHQEMFSVEAVENFELIRYRLAPDSDRMGYRLEGERLEMADDMNLISSAVPVGSVQVPSGGLPIVLMADHQTTGGYPRIATVISADLSVLAQLKASDWIEFEPCTQAAAARALIIQERALMAADP